MKTPKLPHSNQLQDDNASVDENIKKWAQFADCKRRFDACDAGISFVKAKGNFIAGATKTLKQALQITAGPNLETAFLPEMMVGIICQESAFATNIPTTRPNIKGAFQIGKDAMTDYNARNPSNKITYPDDLDEFNDMENAAKAGAWYYATCLQQLTFSTPLIKPVSDLTEAKKFGVAAYNGGVGDIRKAREITKEADRSTWDVVKTNLEAAGVKPDKAKEIRDYVEKVMEYALKSVTCWCK